MTVLLQIALGGALGAVARYGVTLWSVRALGVQLPWGTLAVNVVGSLVMGFLVGLLGARFPGAYLALTGFLGAFTTFSAFSLDMVLMVERGAVAGALFYALLSVVLCVGGCALAFLLGRSLV